MITICGKARGWYQSDFHREDKYFMKRRINPVVVVCILIAVVTLIGIATTLIMRRIPTRKQMDLTEY